MSSCKMITEDLKKNKTNMKHKILKWFMTREKQRIFGIPPFPPWFMPLQARQ